jgi:hypothetical protein
MVVTGDDRIRRNKAARAAYRSAELSGFVLARAYQKTPMHKLVSFPLWRWPEMEQLFRLVGGAALYDLPVNRSSKITRLRFDMSSPTLILHRANVFRKRGHWQHEDYVVCDGERDVGRIFLDANGTWFWGVDFFLTYRSRYGHAPTLEEAKAALRAEYEKWKGTNDVDAG